MISALHKSMRGSDVQASLYYLGELPYFVRVVFVSHNIPFAFKGRMLEAGELPLYIARRLIRFASEDIGLADPNALVQVCSNTVYSVPLCRVVSYNNWWSND
jgi:putative ATPase